ncbi:MAG: DUF2911 domain-containing protein [Acidobacteriota bacterium]
MYRKLAFFLVCATLIMAACGSSEPPAEPASTPSEAQPPPSKRGTAEATIGEAGITINYGRPRLEGRDMLGRLQDGQVWRLGMDEATEIESSSDLAFGETTIKAGRYSLFLKKVSDQEWRLIFNSATGIWGTAYDAAEDVSEVPLEASQPGESVEQLTIEILPSGEKSGEISIRWATLQLKGAFQVQ